MPRLVTCPQCSVRMKLSDKPRTVIQCPKCKTTFKIRTKESTKPPADERVGATAKEAAVASGETDNATPDDTDSDVDHKAEDWPGDDEWSDGDDWSADDWSDEDSDEADWHGADAGRNSLPPRRKGLKKKKSGSKKKKQKAAGENSDGTMLGGLPVRGSVMDHDVYDETKSGKSVPGMGIVYSLQGFVASGPGILLMIIVAIVLAIGLPLVNLYFEWEKDTGAADGDLTRQIQTLGNVKAVADGVTKVSTADEDDNLVDVVKEAARETEDSIRENNQIMNNARAEQKRKAMAESAAAAVAAARKKEREQARQDAAEERRKSIARTIAEMQLTDWTTEVPSPNAMADVRYQLKFVTELKDLEFCVSEAQDGAELKWQKALTELETPADGAATFSRDAAMNASQHIMYLPDDSLQRLQTETLPVHIRIGTERMVVTALDDYQTAARVSRTDGIWHEVTEPAFIIANPDEDNPEYFQGHQVLLSDRKKVVSWIPQERHLGERHLHLKWKGPYGDYVFQYRVPLRIESRTEVLDRQATEFMTLPLAREDIWQPVDSANSVELKPVNAPRYRISSDARAVGRGSSKVNEVFVQPSPENPQELTTNVRDRDNQVVILDMSDHNAVPLTPLKTGSSLEKADNNFAAPQIQEGVLRIPTGEPIVELTTVAGLPVSNSLPADQFGDTTGLRPRTRILPPSSTGKLACVLADSQTLLRVDPATGNIQDAWTTPNDIVDMCHCREGICLLIRSRDRGRFDSGSRFLITGNRNAEAQLEASRMAILDERSLREKAVYSVNGEAVCSAENTPFVFVSTSATVAAIDVDEGLLTGLTTVGDSRGSSGDPRIELSLDDSTQQLTAFVNQQYVAWDVSEGTFAEKTRGQGLELGGQVRIHSAIQRAFVPLANGILAITPSAADDQHTHIQRIGPRSVKSAAVDCDPATRTIVAAVRYASGNFPASQLHVLFGAWSRDLSDLVPDAFAVRNLGPHRFLMLSDGQIALLTVQQQAPAWSFEYPVQNSLQTREPTVQAVIPERPLQATERNPDGSLRGVSGHKVLFPSPDESALFLTAVDQFIVTKMSWYVLRRFDSETLRETHQIRISRNTRNVDCYPTRTGILVHDRTARTLSLYAWQDLNPVWHCDLGFVRDFKHLPEEDAISFSDGSGQVMVEVATAKVIRRTGVYQRLLK